MSRFREKMYRFMYGRYGTDKLYNFLTYTTLFLIVAEMIAIAFIPDGSARAIVSTSFSVVIMALFVWNIYRTMSKQIAKRRRENEAYLKMSRKLRIVLCGNVSRRTKSINRDDCNFVFRDCTKCSSTLRLPRKTGKNKVKCPRCSHSFYVKVRKFNYKGQKNKR